MKLSKQKYDYFTQNGKEIIISNQVVFEKLLYNYKNFTDLMYIKLVDDLRILSKKTEFKSEYSDLIKLNKDQDLLKRSDKYKKNNQIFESFMDYIKQLEVNYNHIKGYIQNLDDDNNFKNIPYIPLKKENNIFLNAPREKVQLNNQEIINATIENHKKRYIDKNI